MASKCPVFPMPESSHFGDYGFDLQIDYFKGLKEGKRHRKPAVFSAGGASNVNKGSSKGSPHEEEEEEEEEEEADGGAACKTENAKKKKWWSRASLLMFWKKKRFGHKESFPRSFETKRTSILGTPRSSTSAPSSCSCPVYGSVEDFMLSRKSLPATPIRKGGGRTRRNDDAFDVPYLNLKELNMGLDNHRFSTSSSPIYLVT